MPNLNRFLSNDTSTRARSNRDQSSRERLSALSQSRESSRSEFTEANASGKRLSLRKFIAFAIVLFSVVGGYLAFSSADKRIEVVTLSRDLSAGQQIMAADLSTALAVVPLANYFTEERTLIGKTLAVDVKRGDLLARSALSDASRQPQVAVAIKRIYLPALTRGDRVSLWSDGQFVAQDLVVSDVVRESSTGVVTVQVPEPLLPAVVGVLATDVRFVKQ